MGRHSATLAGLSAALSGWTLLLMTPTTGAQPVLWAATAAFVGLTAAVVATLLPRAWPGPRIGRLLARAFLLGGAAAHVLLAAHADVAGAAFAGLGMAGAAIAVIGRALWPRRFVRAPADQIVITSAGVTALFALAVGLVAPPVLTMVGTATAVAAAVLLLREPVAARAVPGARTAHALGPPRVATALHVAAVLSVCALTVVPPTWSEVAARAVLTPVPGAGHIPLWPLLMASIAPVARDHGLTAALLGGAIVALSVDGAADVPLLRPMMEVAVVTCSAVLVLRAVAVQAQTNGLRGATLVLTTCASVAFCGGLVGHLRLLPEPVAWIAFASLGLTACAVTAAARPQPQLKEEKK